MKRERMTQEYINGQFDAYEQLRDWIDKHRHPEMKGRPEFEAFLLRGIYAFLDGRCEHLYTVNGRCDLCEAKEKTGSAGTARFRREYPGLSELFSVYQPKK